MKLKLFFGFFILLGNVNLFSESAWEVLKQLMRANKLDEFSQKMDQHPELLDAQDKLGMTLTMMACANDKPDFVKHLVVDRKANILLENDFPGSPTARSLAKIYSPRIFVMFFLKLIGFKK